jgi:hypothetical protein
MTHHNKRRVHSSDHPEPFSTESELAAIADLPVNALREVWGTRLGADAPSIQSGDILRQLLAWQFQSNVLGGLDRATERALTKIGEALQRDGSYEPKIRRELSPGAVLTREWKGFVHKVTVTPDGFQHQGKQFRSLSDIARTITGTRWSGPRFFGLEQKAARSRKAQL